MALKKIDYIKKNWKLAIHLFFRTKRFGVNNRWWNEFDSLFGLSLLTKIKSIVLIRPMIDNYISIRMRIQSCHFIGDNEKALFGFKSLH